ncbi:hypothetical protein N7454_007321 [Penicillium verhagenii]|nr:hypothetical protein N7454_007321 [Penicillium verhagenii]
MDRPEVIEPPQKRQKTQEVTEVDAVIDALPQAAGVVEDVQTAKERGVGITELVTANIDGFSGTLKKRYTDFLVNEITPSGQVLHLRNPAVPESLGEKKDETQQPEAQAPAPAVKEEAPDAVFSVSEEDNTLLCECLGDQNAADTIKLHARAMSDRKARPAEFGKVTLKVTDRDQRTKIHMSIRRIFKSQLESTTDNDGNLDIMAAANRFKRNIQQQTGRVGGRAGGGRVSWDELGGQYLHFTIYKENKDTMEVISFLARQMKMNAKLFQFAGTKDRRGVTAQRACVVRVHAHRLAKMNDTLRNARLGDFEYRKHGLDLGDLHGNEFVITLRDCQVPGVGLEDPQAAVTKATEIVRSSLKNLHDRGYFNYYGLQRFGTFSTRTDTVGVKILQDDFEGACNAILHFPPHVLAAAEEGEASTALISSDDKARAKAIHIFKTTGNVNDALSELPRKFSAEASIIRQQGWGKNDYLGALQAIPRNLRLMYVHAYQSLVWNFAASERWRLYGDKVVEGDLVIVQEHREKEGDNTENNETIDADGEIIVVPQGGDSANSTDDLFLRARALTAEEVASGKYSLFDIVLPLPGFDVIYPPNKMTDFYREFMASERGGGLDPFNMRRKWKDASLSGSYRKIFSRMGTDYSFDIKLYSQEDQQFVKTDLENLQSDSQAPVATPASPAGDKLAIVLKFQLGSSQYATMALRELSKGLVHEWKPDLGGGR